MIFFIILDQALGIKEKVLGKIPGPYKAGDKKIVQVQDILF